MATTAAKKAAVATALDRATGKGNGPSSPGSALRDYVNTANRGGNTATRGMGGNSGPRGTGGNSRPASQKSALNDQTDNLGHRPRRPVPNKGRGGTRP